MLLENLPNNYFNSIHEFELFQELKPIGIGSFGIVRKAIHKFTNKIYAIKIIEITQEMSQTEKLLLEREITIHYQLDHPHIIKLWAVLKQQNKVYMIMDYAKNRSLFFYHKQIKKFSEPESFHIFYQVLQAIEYMHRRDVFHRDLKPENILLDHNFNILICDFGWVAEQIERKRTTFCGTYEYMAPEMLDGKSYDYRIDLWALGVLLYELNHGKAPFEGTEIQIIKEKLKKGNYEIKESLSCELKELIISILQYDPDKRLSISQIKESAWLKKNKNTLNTLQAKKNKELKDDHFKHQTKKKNKFHKKYRTLEEEDFAQLSDSVKLHKLLNYVNPGTESVKENLQQKFIQQQNKKKKKSSIQTNRQHLRTQSNEFLNKKIRQIVLLPTKFKVFDKEMKKKKVGNRKC